MGLGYGLGQDVFLPSVGRQQLVPLSLSPAAATAPAAGSRTCRGPASALVTLQPGKKRTGRPVLKP